MERGLKQEHAARGSEPPLPAAVPLTHAAAVLVGKAVDQWSRSVKGTMLASLHAAGFEAQLLGCDEQTR